jgi:hypothetical protein
MWRYEVLSGGGRLAVESVMTLREWLRSKSKSVVL